MENPLRSNRQRNLQRPQAAINCVLITTTTRPSFLLQCTSRILKLLWGYLSYVYSMLPSKRPYLADEELGKKDDDHRPRTGRKPLWRAKQWRAPRPRRLIIGIIVLYLVYLFFKNMPTDLPPAVERLHPGFTQTQQSSGKSRPPPMLSSVTPAKGPPPRADSHTNIKEDFYYEGEIRFNALARTLQRFWKPPTRHGGSISRAVVFAGSNLRSVSDLLPLACRMAEQKINEVHFVLMGRDDVSIEGIQRVNGINEVDCPIVWHGVFSLE